ncbi:hypothetical protein [Ferrimicrobium sp.]|uniref:hypothetical protein n=1 Tax=Ferrimicrobium sp. TaxID=2926050 RepID=UPI002602907D|nr:hypothetical protein [Ferrimicrobium sp.]
MRKIEEILRLSAQGKSARAISRDTGVSRPSVAAYLEKAPEHEISWPLPEGMDVQALEQLLFPSVATPKSTPGLPDWGQVTTELATHHHLTLQLLWFEYKEQNLLTVTKTCTLTDT